MSLLALSLFLTSTATGAQTVEQFLHAVQAGNESVIRKSLAEEVYFSQHINFDRKRAVVDKTKLAATFADFRKFSLKYTILQMKELSRSVRVIWNCERIDPPTCETEFFIEGDKIVSIDHSVNAAATF